MILSKAGKLTLLAGLLCLLLMGFAGASYGAVRFDVVPSPTEVINTGRAEVLGSVNLIVASPGLTGTSTNGWAQIGIIYNNGVQVDNWKDTDPFTGIGGIRLSFSTGFDGGAGTRPDGGEGIHPYVVAIQNLSITGRCSGFITINIPPGLTVAQNDFIRLEGVRGRIDISDGNVAGTDLFAQLQSINDPAANSFFPETIRVAKSLPGMVVDVHDDNVLLCFPPVGLVPGSEESNPNYYIRITEGFVRAFVSIDSNNTQRRTDTALYPLGSPSNSTQVRLVLNSIPSSIASVSFPSYSSTYSSTGGTSWLQLTTTATVTPASDRTAEATYTYVTTNQTDYSDISLETFTVVPVLNVSTTNQTDTGTVLAAATLYPAAGSIGSCDQPDSTSPWAQPRFATLWQSSNNVSSTSKTSTTFDLYATIVRCNCFLLYTYVTKDSFWNTGMVVANTTGDDEVFGTNGAPNQLGAITFYFYDKAAGYVGSTTTTSTYGPGRSFVGLLSQILPSTVTSFSGYVIAKAEFQYCHGYAFISDSTFAQIAQGYLANVIPDPAIKGGSRQPAAAGDYTNVPAGESINN